MSTWKTNSFKKDKIFPRKETSCNGRNLQMDFDVSLPHKNAGSNFQEVEKTQIRSDFTLKPLKKEPLEDYFSQTKKKKKSGKFRLPQNELQTSTEEENNPQKSKKKESEEEKLEREKYLMRYFELERKIQNDERMSYLQHKLAEEEYIFEQEKLAETWMTFINKRRQLIEEKERKEIAKNSSWRGQRSEGRTWTNGGLKVKKWSNRKGWLGKKMRETETQILETSSLDDLGEEFSEKLTFPDEQ